MGLRVRESVRIGPFRIGVSLPLGRGRTRAYAGTRMGPFWTGVSAPLGRRRRKRSSLHGLTRCQRPAEICYRP
jgi:hypothetical protein